MSFFSFLTDNYIWIMIALLVLVIGVIGFLVDSKKKKVGANAVERRITTDRTNWGSDQAASLETAGLYHMVRDIRQTPILLGDGVKVVYPRELPIIEKLRRVK